MNCSERGTESKLSVPIRGTHQLLQTQQDFSWHKGMRYNPPTPASPEYSLAVLIFCRGKWKVRRSPDAVHGGWVSAVTQQRHWAENTPHLQVKTETHTRKQSSCSFTFPVNRSWGQSRLWALQERDFCLSPLYFSSQNWSYLRSWQFF